jgi:hypothetical protein
MANTPQQHPIDEPRRAAHESANGAEPQDPQTNTLPRGNGPLDGAETQKSARKLEEVVGH